MKLTFPIDTVEPGEIPAFSRIFMLSKADPETLSKMLRYLCWRFDPKSADIRAMSGVDAKRAAAEAISGYRVPDPEATVGDDGELRFSDGWEEYCAVEAMFMGLIDDLRYKFILSIEMAIDQCNRVIRTPIPQNASPDIEAKTIISIQKAMEGNSQAFKTMSEQIAWLADNDPQTIFSISRATKGRAPVSPESMVNDDDD
jgi:hypothetical protein